MRSKILQDLLDETPEDVKIFTDLYADMVVRINALIKAKYGTQKALAEDLNKRPSEITKWLSGNHNLTLKTIAKLTAALDEPIIQVPEALEYKQVKHSSWNITVNSASVSTSNKLFKPGKVAGKLESVKMQKVA